MKSVKAMIYYTEANFQDIFLYVVLMVSAIIVTIGLLKPLLYNKIKCKELRKVALAFSNVALCFIAALIVFVLEGWNFDHYIAASIVLAVTSIVIYWLYENTCLRNLIATIGNIVLRKFGSVALLTMEKQDINEIKTEAKKAVTELKAQTSKELKKTAKTIKEDKDLKGL